MESSLQNRLILLLLATLPPASLNAQLASPSLTRGPYLQLGGEDTVTIVWNTDVAASAVVEYGETPGFGNQSFGAGATASLHVVTLGALAPGTEYHYRILSDEQELARSTFRTFPLAGCETPFRLAAWGDSGTGDRFQLGVADLLVELLPDVAIHTGDLIYNRGEAENYDPRYFQPYAALVSRINVHNSLGNHDVITENGQPYLDAFFLPTNNPAGTERYYSFDYGNAHFTCIDTNQPFEPGDPQHTWIDRDLASSEAFWKIAFHHHNPYTAGIPHTRDAINEPIRRHLGSLYDLHGVDLVFLGHTHAYERTLPIRGELPATDDPGPDYLDAPGTIYITTGGGGRFLNDHDEDHPNNAFQVLFVPASHATTVDFDGARLRGQAVSSSGQTLDAFTLEKTTLPLETDDCNANGIPDRCDLAAAESPDCNGDGVLDSCEIELSAASDCDGNGRLDVCDVELDPALDGNGDGVLDVCETSVLVGLLARPAEVILPAPRRAIAFAAVVSPGVSPEGLTWNDSVFTNVGEGELERLIDGALLYREVSGNGVFDAADEVVGTAREDGLADERLVFTGLGLTLPARSNATYYLVLDLAGGDVAAGFARGLRTKPWRSLPWDVLLAAAFVALAAPLAKRRWPRVAVASILIAAGLLLSPAGCSSGGGGGASAPAMAKTLQLELTALEATATASGEAVSAEGLPLTAWSFDT